MKKDVFIKGILNLRTYLLISTVYTALNNIQVFGTRRISG